MRMTAMVLAACMICSVGVFADRGMPVTLADGETMRIYETRVTLPEAATATTSSATRRCWRRSAARTASPSA